MEKPLVSLMIPTCDNIATIERCLDSVLNQGYENLMVGVLDNRSTDGTYDVILDYEKRYRDRLYTGRTYTRMSPAEHRDRTMGLISPRTRFMQYVRPTDLLDRTYVVRCLELIEANKRLGCVLAHTDLIDGAGTVLPARRFVEPTPFVPGDEQMRSFMEHGLENNTSHFYRIEVYTLARSEGIVFNQFLEWLPLVMGSSIADFCHLADPLILRGDAKALLGEAYVPSLEALFEHYLFLHSFNNIAARLGRTRVCECFPRALERLGMECIRSASVLLERGDRLGARGYASLTLAFVPEVGESPAFQRISGLIEAST